MAAFETFDLRIVAGVRGCERYCSNRQRDAAAANDNSWMMMMMMIGKIDYDCDAMVGGAVAVRFL